MLSCDQVLAELQDYLDDDLAAEVRQQLDGHLSHCKTCRVIYDSLKRTLTLVTESGSFTLPQSVSGKIQQRVMERIKKDWPES
ncbi:MAG: zf-HC2 domain-containing protein [Acidobacteria bacterium]|nr:zf-HC2 domain-containing protein [Acidobacteriota bacterium]